MLVISRKAHEFLQIGEDIVIKVVKTSCGSVKIGIEAPDGLRILRGELSEFPEPVARPSSRFHRAKSSENGDVGRLRKAEVL